MAGFLARLAILLAALAAAAIAAAGALAFLCLALYLFLRNHMSPPIAALASCGALLVLALLLLLIGSMLSRRKKKNRLFDNGPGASRTAANIGEMLGNEIRAFAGDHTREAIIASLLAGLIVGASPKLRAFLRALLKS